MGSVYLVVNLPGPVRPCFSCYHSCGRAFGAVLLMRIPPIPTIIFHLQALAFCPLRRRDMCGGNVARVNVMNALRSRHHYTPTHMTHPPRQPLSKQSTDLTSKSSQWSTSHILWAEGIHYHFFPPVCPYSRAGCFTLRTYTCG